MEKAKLPARLMVDCSHANANKQHLMQIEVTKDIAAQMAAGHDHIFGVMIESHLLDGAQKFTPGKDSVGQLTYGQSITDPCLGWEDSVACLRTLSEAVQKRRKERGR